MSTRKRTAWISESGSWLGVVGADSLDEMAEIIVEQGEHSDVHGSLREDIDEPINPTDLAAVRAWLDIAPVEALIVPAVYMSAESWDGSHIYPAQIGDRPGRGKVKVLGIDLEDVPSIAEATR